MDYSPELISVPEGEKYGTFEMECELYTATGNYPCKFHKVSIQCLIIY